MTMPSRVRVLIIAGLILAVFLIRPPLILIGFLVMFPWEPGHPREPSRVRDLIFAGVLIMSGLIRAAYLKMFPWEPALAREPSPSPSCCCCSRSLFTTLWGFAFAFVGLTLDAWHTADAHAERAASFLTKLYYAVFFGPVVPFLNLLAL